MKFPNTTVNDTEHPRLRCLNASCGWDGTFEEIVFIDKDVGSYYQEDLIPVPCCPRCKTPLC